MKGVEYWDPRKVFKGSDRVVLRNIWSLRPYILGSVLNNHHVLLTQSVLQSAYGWLGLSFFT